MRKDWMAIFKFTVTGFESVKMIVCTIMSSQKLNQFISTLARWCIIKNQSDLRTVWLVIKKVTRSNVVLLQQVSADCCDATICICRLLRCCNMYLAIVVLQEYVSVECCDATICICRLLCCCNRYLAIVVLQAYVSVDCCVATTGICRLLCCYNRYIPIVVLLQ